MSSFGKSSATKKSSPPRGTWWRRQLPFEVPVTINSDYIDILRYFVEETVQFLVVGGYAVMKHSEPYNTKDLDLWIAPHRANADRAYRSPVLAPRSATLRLSPWAHGAASWLRQEDAEDAG